MSVKLCIYTFIGLRMYVVFVKGNGRTTGPSDNDARQIIVGDEGGEEVPFCWYDNDCCE